MAFEPNKVTWYSKALAMAVFVALPFIAFWLGVKYAQLKFAATLSVVPGNEAQCITGDACVYNK